MLYDAAIREDVRLHDRLCQRNNYACFLNTLGGYGITTSLWVHQYISSTPLKGRECTQWRRTRFPAHDREEETMIVRNKHGLKNAQGASIVILQEDRAGHAHGLALLVRVVNARRDELRTLGRNVRSGSYRVS